MCLRKTFWSLAVLLSFRVCCLSADQDPEAAHLLVLPDKEDGRIQSALISATAITTNRVSADRQIQSFFFSMYGALAIGEKTEQQSILLRSQTWHGKTNSITITDAKLPKNFKGKISPDGTRLCLFYDAARRDTIKVLNLKNGLLEDVFTITGQASPPAWAPDSSRIAYYFAKSSDVTHDEYRVGISKKSQGAWQHHVITPPSKPARRSRLRHSAPTWSSDGTAIVFEARYTELREGPQTYLVKVRDQQITRIGGYPLGASPAPGGVVYAELTEVADGITSFETKLCLFNTSTGKSSMIPAVETACFPRFSPDMQWLAYSDHLGHIYIASQSNPTQRRTLDTGQDGAVNTFYWVPSNSLADSHALGSE